MPKQMNKYRHEYKYLANGKLLDLIEFNVKHILELDKYCRPAGIYKVNSLYFDDYKNGFANDNNIGINKRYKWRIRYYNDDLSNILLEKKIKFNGLCRKEVCRISIEQFNEIIKCDNIYRIIYETESQLLKQFCIEMMTKMLCPKLIVEYERTAYINNASNIRITFDRNICVSNETDCFLSDYTKTILNNNNQHILEIKFDDVLPSYIQRLPYFKELRQASFSKYYLGRRKVEVL